MTSIPFDYRATACVLTAPLPNPRYIQTHRVPASDTVADYLVRDFGGGHEERGLGWRMDVLHASKAAPSEDLWHVGVDRDNVIPSARKFFKDLDAVTPELPRDSDQGDTFPSEKVLDR